MEETVRKLKENLEPIYGKGESDAIIRLIFHHLKGWSLTDMLVHSQDELSPFIKQEIDVILSRLLEHEPIQYITGEARFYGMDLNVKPGVLIPRRETEELVDIIVEENKGEDDLKVLDLCTGSGCIAIALARNLPFSKVTAIDFSDEALEVAKENNNKLKSGVILKKCDIFDTNIYSVISENQKSDKYPLLKFNIIVSNPPYVMDKEALGMERNVLDYEPHEALFVRDDQPLVFYDRIADIGKELLKDGGKLYFELNPIKAEDIKNMLKERGFYDVEIIRDSFGKKRFIKATFKG